LTLYVGTVLKPSHIYLYSASYNTDY